MLYEMTSSQRWNFADTFNFLTQGRTVIHPAAVSNSKCLSILGTVFQFQNVLGTGRQRRGGEAYLLQVSSPIA